MTDQTLWAQPAYAHSPAALSQALMRYQSSRMSVLNSLERKATEKKSKPIPPSQDEGVTITLSAAAQAKMAEAPT